MADFQEHIAEFDKREILVLGASVDTLEDAQKTLARHKLTFPLAYGLSAKEFSALTGAFFDVERECIHATGFVIRPDGKIANAVYSTGAIGRYTSDECLKMIDHLAKKMKEENKA